MTEYRATFSFRFQQFIFPVFGVIFVMSDDTRKELMGFNFDHFGETSLRLQAVLLMWKQKFEKGKAEAKAPANIVSSTSGKMFKASLKFGPTAKRLKASSDVPKPASRSEEPEPRAITVTPSVDITSVNYVELVNGSSQVTAAAQRGAASTDPQVSTGTCTATNTAGN